MSIIHRRIETRLVKAERQGRSPAVMFWRWLLMRLLGAT
jgi:hypothetical protein